TRRGLPLRDRRSGRPVDDTSPRTTRGVETPRRRCSRELLAHRCTQEVHENERQAGLGQAGSVAGRGSLGRPRTRSPTMFRWIWLVPPQIVSEREKKNADIIG